MRRPRFQFRLSTLFWVTLAVGCWFGGMRFEQWRVDREEWYRDSERRERINRQRLETLDKFDDPT
ncbi:MAG TPA: hypothetical protein VND64_32110 [Pirellulales bacterium]|nr:hypothetical protein [Pirellulales bacterium]